MSLSGLVEIPRLQAKRGFVIPAEAGMTGTKVDFQSTNSESHGLQSRVVQFSGDYPKAD
jgi:hypothetical protein